MDPKGRKPMAKNRILRGALDVAGVAAAGVPMNFDDRPGADANMDGRAPIAAGPAVGAEPAAAADATFNAQVDREVAARIHVREQEHATALSAATAQGARDTALSQLNAMIDGNPGETLDAMKLRDSLRGMVNQILSGSDKPPGEFLAEAARLSEARAQQLAATSVDTEADALAEVHADGPAGYQTFAGAYMGALFNESKAAWREPGRREADRLAGNGIRVQPARQAGHARRIPAA